MTFAICSLALGEEYKQTVNVCTQSQEEYAKRHDYTRITDESVYDPSRPFPWSKIRLVQKYLSEYDFLVWMDADVLVTNPEIRIEVFIEMMKPDAFMFLGRDFQNLNTGVFVIRNCPMAHEFLSDVWNKTEYLHHIWWEQAAVIDLWKNSEKYQPHISILEHRHMNIMNAFHHQVDPKVHWLPGDFCIHFAGIHDKKILGEIQKWYVTQASTDPSGIVRIEKCKKERYTVDAFMFYNELDVLELRLKVLDPYVDKFVLVESEVTHSGHSKVLYFEQNKARFSKWIPKIEHVIIKREHMPADDDPWVREKFQRECILQGLEGVDGNATVMISDVDEIPDVTKIVRTHPVNSIHMWMFEYSFKYLFTGEPWFGTVVTNCELVKRMGPNYFRSNRWKFPHIQHAGWHLSSFGDAAHVVNKHLTFAHWKDKRPIEMTKENFEKFIQHGVHTDGSTKLIPRPCDVPLPLYANKFLD
jgi:beta-1,4-mannosyl-glycoprotein beta-1,4-N-acetylglucosaminyltransferase